MQVEDSAREEELYNETMADNNLDNTYNSWGIVRYMVVYISFIYTFPLYIGLGN